MRPVERIASDLDSSDLLGLDLSVFPQWRDHVVHHLTFAADCFTH